MHTLSNDVARIRSELRQAVCEYRLAKRNLGQATQLKDQELINHYLKMCASTRRKLNTGRKALERILKRTKR